MKKINKENINEKTATIWFPESVLDRIDRLAERGGVNRSHLIRNLTIIGVEQLEISEKLGLLQTSLVLRDFGEWFRAKLDSRLLNGQGKKA